MNDRLENLSVLRECGNGLDRDAGVCFGLSEDKGKGYLRLLDEIESCAKGPEVIGARTGWDKNEIGIFENVVVLFGQGWRRVNKTVGEASIGEGSKFLGKLADVQGRQLGDLCRTEVPPRSECLLGVGINENGRAVLGVFSGESEMCGEGGLATAALLRSNNDFFHSNHIGVIR